MIVMTTMMTMMMIMIIIMIIIIIISTKLKNCRQRRYSALNMNFGKC